MKKLFSVWIIVVGFLLVGSSVQATPYGTTYQFWFDGYAGGMDEGHYGSFLADTVPEILLNDYTASGLLPGNDLAIDELAFEYNGYEFVEIWIYGYDPPLTEQSFPSGPLFNNRVSEVHVTIDDFYWIDFDGAAEVVGHHFAVTGPDGLIKDVEPFYITGTGAGTEEDPLWRQARFEGEDFFFTGDDGGLIPATDFHLILRIEHVPESGSTMIFASLAVLGLMGLRKRAA